MEGVNHDNRSLLLIIFFSFWSDVELILLFTEGFYIRRDINSAFFSASCSSCPKDILLLYRVFVRKPCKRVFQRLAPVFYLLIQEIIHSG